MTATDRTTAAPLDLGAVRARISAQTTRYAAADTLPTAEAVRRLAEDRDRLIEQDVPALLAEVERLRAKVAESGVEQHRAHRDALIAPENVPPMSEPITPETLAKIRRSDEWDLRIAEKTEGALDETAWERHVLLAEVDRLRAQRDALITLHEYDELIFGGFICTFDTPDDCDDPDDNVAWPCPSLRAVGMTDEEAIAHIQAHRDAVNAAALAPATT